MDIGYLVFTKTILDRNRRITFIFPCIHNHWHIAAPISGINSLAGNSGHHMSMSSRRIFPTSHYEIAFIGQGLHFTDLHFFPIRAIVHIIYHLISQHIAQFIRITYLHKHSFYSLITCSYLHFIVFYNYLYRLFRSARQFFRRSPETRLVRAWRFPARVAAASAATAGTGAGGRLHRGATVGAARVVGTRIGRIGMAACGAVPSVRTAAAPGGRWAGTDDNRVKNLLGGDVLVPHIAAAPSAGLQQGFEFLPRVGIALRALCPDGRRTAPAKSPGEVFFRVASQFFPIVN